MSDQKPELPAGTITIVETIYHRVFGEDATSVNTKLSRNLSTDEQKWERRGRASESMDALDLGWFADKLDSISYIRIANDEGKFLQVNPTDEQREEMAAKVLVLSVDGVPFDQISPGDSRRMSPPDVSAVRVQSASGVTRFTVTVYPS